jgi:hypothetical protein
MAIRRNLCCGAALFMFVWLGSFSVALTKCAHDDRVSFDWAG